MLKKKEVIDEAKEVIDDSDDSSYDDMENGSNSDSESDEFPCDKEDSDDDFR